MSTKLVSNFNVDPYWDDYDPNDKYHRILFRPGVALQARELTQLQTILQEQVSRFGEHIFAEGTLLKGCNFSYGSVQYVKFPDLNVAGQPFNVLGLDANNIAVEHTSGVQAAVIDKVDGLESRNPDLKTVYFKYLATGKTAADALKTQFESGDEIFFYDKTKVQAANVTFTSSHSFSNGDAVVQVSTGTRGVIETTANGQIVRIKTLQGFLKDSSTIVLESNTAVNSSVSSIDSSYLVDKVVVAASSFANAQTNTAITGAASRFTISDGVAFQKGHFVIVDEQSIVLERYSPRVSDKVLGLYSSETIVNNSVDFSLNDNASGFSNENAPGAFRLKINPQLVLMSESDAAANSELYRLVEFKANTVYREYDSTRYNALGDEMAKRTYEESGSYVVSRFPVGTEAISGNTTHLNITVGAGLGYVEGYRVQNINLKKLPIPKADTRKTLGESSVTLSYGNYIEVNNLWGSFTIDGTTTVNLNDTAGNPYNGASASFNSTPNPTTTIGTARVRMVERQSGGTSQQFGVQNTVYRLYLFDVKMNAGYSFADVRNVEQTGAASADVIVSTFVSSSSTQQTGALLKGTANPLVYRTGLTGLVEDAVGGNGSIRSATYVFRTKTSDTFGSASGESTFTLTEGEFNVGASNDLDTLLRNTFLAVPTNDTYSTDVTSTATSNLDSTTIRGTGTTYLTDFTAGDFIRVGGQSDDTSKFYQITDVVDNLTLKVQPALTGAIGGSINLYRALPAGTPINLSAPWINFKIENDGGVPKKLTINLFADVAKSNALNLNTDSNYDIFYDNKVDSINTFKTKSLVTGFVGIDLANTTVYPSTEGPFTLGVPDVHEIVAIYKDTTYGTGGTDVTNQFILDNGQTEEYYGIAKLNKKLTSTLSLTGSDKLTVQLRFFSDTTTGTKYFYTAESYPIDDANTANTQAITTQEIPLFSSKSGETYNLRNSIDFRPRVTPSVSTPISSVANTPSEPTSDGTTLTFSGNPRLPSPNKRFDFTPTVYEPRKDVLYITSAGTLAIAQGVANTEAQPTIPIIPNNALKLADINVPVYPSISSKESRSLANKDLVVSAFARQPRRYTMNDINQLDKRLRNVEYYVSLNALEKSAADLTIPSAVDTTLSRFKNGIWVENFSIANTADVRSDELNTIPGSTLYGKLAPMVKNYNIPMKIKSSTGLSHDGDNVVLAYTGNSDVNASVLTLQQPYANTQRVVVEAMFNFRANVRIFPDYDAYYDENVTPIDVELDNASALEQAITGLVEVNNGLSLNHTVSEIISENTVQENFEIQRTGSSQQTTRATWTDVTTQTINNTTTSLVGSEVTSHHYVGEFITDQRLMPFIRSRPVLVAAFGLKPGSRYYVYFDETAVSSQCRSMKMTGSSATQRGVYNSAVSLNDDWQGNASIGAINNRGEPLIADEFGQLLVDLLIPADTFNVGTHEIGLSENATYANFNSSAATGKGTYNAYNFNVDKTDLTISNKTISYTVDRNEWTSANVIETDRSQRVANPNFRESDDLSEGASCFVKGTKVTMANGIQKNIEDVQIGDKLLGQDKSINTVLEFDHPMLGGRDLIGINEGGPFMTPEHPLYTEEGWKSFCLVDTIQAYPHLQSLMVGELQIGDKILQQDGSWLTIETLEIHSEEPEQQVFNFILDGNNTYFADGLLAHNRDPLAQSFLVSSTMAQQQDGIFLDSVNLYFRKSPVSKSTTESTTQFGDLQGGKGGSGVILELREVRNGQPSRVKVPYGVAFVGADDIVLPSPNTIDSNGNIVSGTTLPATNFKFPTPVYLRAGTEYAMIIMPVPFDPDYQVFTYLVGTTDIQTGTQLSTDTGVGYMFLSSNDRTYIALNGEDAKFDLNKAVFTSSSGNVTMVPDDVEVLDIQSYDNGYDNGFSRGEIITGEAKTANNTGLVKTVKASSAGIVSFKDIASMALKYIIGNRTNDFLGNSIASNYDYNSSGSVNISDSVAFLKLQTGDRDLYTDIDGGDANTTFVEYARDNLNITNLGYQLVSLNNDTNWSTGAAGQAVQVGDRITVWNDTGDKSQVNTVTLVGNNTVIYCRDPWLFEASNTNWAHVDTVGTSGGVLSGIVEYYDPKNERLIIRKSNASASANLYWEDGSKLYAAESNTIATVNTGTLNISYFQPLLNRVILDGTTMTATYGGKFANGDSYSGETLYFGENNLNYTGPSILKSKSDLIAASDTSDQANLQITLQATGNTSSPFFNKHLVYMNTYEYVINGASDISARSAVESGYPSDNSIQTGAPVSSETGNRGNAKAKYIAKPVALADGLDAEDVRVYITAHRPSGTDIEVYIKILNSADPQKLEDKDWTKLDYIENTENVFTTRNKNDYFEYELTFPETPLSKSLSATVGVESGNTIVTTSEDLSSSLSSGDLVKLVNTDSNLDYYVGVINSANSTTVTLENSIATTFTEGRIEKVLQTQGAFKNPNNDGIVRYYDNGQRPYDTYKYFVIKVVMLSDTFDRAPKVDDIRLLAVSV